MVMNVNKFGSHTDVLTTLQYPATGKNILPSGTHYINFWHWYKSQVYYNI